MATARGKPSRQEKIAHLHAALAHVSEFRMALDAGAHVGYWTMVMAERFEKVLAFEPMPDNQEKWRRHLAPFGNAELICKALGDAPRRVSMLGEGHSKHYASADPAGDTDMVTIDSLDLPVLDFLKVDCEGADALVLRGAEATLRRCKPVVIVESLLKFEVRFGLRPGAPMEFLKSLGATQVANFHHDYIFVWK